MLDPVTALGCASAVVQLVDFGAKLIGSSCEIYHSTSGSTHLHMQIEDVTQHIRTLSSHVEQSVLRAGYSNANGDAQLLNLARKSQAVAGELLQILDSLKIDRTQRFQSWQALRQAIRGIKSADKIDAVKARLDDFRSELSLHLLYLINNGQASVAKSIGNLSWELQQMRIEQVDLISRLKQDLNMAIDSQGDEFRRLIRTMKHIDPDSNDRLPDSLRDEDGTGKHAKLGSLGATTTGDYYATITTTAAKDLRGALYDVVSRVEAVILSAQDTASIVNILNSLRYTEMPMRHLEIPEAYKETYAWIFDKRVSPFRAWLQNSNGVFWVSGKAGSGKSTLLKFLADSKRTRGVLKHWASGSRLCLLSFYFWNSGYPMQKTQKGLLQSLLFQVFKSCPDLIREACPHRWSGMDNSFQDAWGREEIMRSLEVALNSQAVKTQYCIFIDGLDEFTGDHYSLVRYFDQLATSPSVKICVSSRPWNVFRSEYESRTDRMLRLEDKTKDDMDIYVKGMLENDPRFRRLAAYDCNARQFAEEIRERADGVFLWVFLVVRSLLRGLSDNDDVATLQRRMRALPPDLKSYFTHMLESVDEIYREQTARSLLVACTAEEPLPILIYWCLETEMASSDFAVSAGIEPVTRSEYDWKRSKATSAINKWCRDLLEERESRWNPLFQIMLTYKVDFLHRTVKDFLTSEEIVELLKKRAGADYNPQLTLCRSWLYISKGLDSREPGDRNTAMTFLGNAMKFACECERHENITPTAELESIDQVGLALCSSGKRGKQHWSGCGSFVEYAEKHDLKLYLQKVSSANSNSRRHRRFLSTTRSRDEDAVDGTDTDGGLQRENSKLRKRDRIRSMFSRSPAPVAPDVKV